MRGGSGKKDVRTVGKRHKKNRIIKINENISALRHNECRICRCVASFFHSSCCDEMPLEWKACAAVWRYAALALHCTNCGLSKKRLVPVDSTQRSSLSRSRPLVNGFLHAPHPNLECVKPKLQTQHMYKIFSPLLSVLVCILSTNLAFQGLTFCQLFFEKKIDTFILRFWTGVQI